MVEVSVIVVSWNAKSYVQECIASVTRSALSVPFEVIVIDNASNDGTPDMVRRLFPRVCLITNEENLGFAKANNQGLQTATGKYLCLVNSDVNVPPECLQAMYDFMVRNTKVGVLGPRMLTSEGHLGRSWMRFPTVWNCLCSALALPSVFRRSRIFGGVLMGDFDGGRTSEVNVLNGWFLMVRREALNAVGPLDESFFMYGEDIDWSYRFRNAGWPRVYFAGAQARHYGGASSANAPTRFYLQMNKANLQCFKKHHSRIGVLGYWLTTFIYHLLRIGGYSLMYLFKRGTQPEASFKIRRSVACIAWLFGSRSAV